MFNKRINKMRFLVTADCNCKCRYCIIYKTKEYMKFPIAKRALELFIDSPGKKKLLMLYGGEPLLHFDLLKSIITYATSLTLKKKKDLTISIATNGILLKREHIQFFKKYNVKLSVSLIGLRKYHDHYRKFLNNRGTFNLISQKLNLIFTGLNKKNISSLFCVYPDQAKEIFYNFLYLIKKGFKNINIETIYNIHWSKKNKNNFVFNFRRIINFLIKQANLNNFIFLNSLNRAFSTKTSKRTCLFTHSCLEVYPDGTLSFFPYISRRIKGKVKIGTVSKGICSRYLRCEYNKNKLFCRDCSFEYYQNPPQLKGREILDIRNRLSKNSAFLIHSLSKKNVFLSRYIREAKKREFE